MRRRIHCGIGLFCFAFFASVRFVRNVLCDGYIDTYPHPSSTTVLEPPNALIHTYHPLQTSPCCSNKICGFPAAVANPRDHARSARFDSRGRSRTVYKNDRGILRHVSPLSYMGTNGRKLHCKRTTKHNTTTRSALALCCQDVKNGFMKTSESSEGCSKRAEKFSQVH